jgi:hypothetical protein
LTRRPQARTLTAELEGNHASEDEEMMGEWRERTGALRERGRARRHTVAAAASDPAAERRRRAVRIDRPAVAPCPDLDDLRALDADAARTHVDAYLHQVMAACHADDFEALSYRWELHLVELEQLCLLRSVDLSRRKLAHYRGVLRKHGGFPPLIGLGGDHRDTTRGVLLCDGYHRAVAMRDVGMHFAWVWLAVGAWTPTASLPVLAGDREG